MKHSPLQEVSEFQMVMKYVCMELDLKVITGKYRPERLLNTDIEVVNVDIHPSCCDKATPNLLAAASRRERCRASQGHSLGETPRTAELESNVGADNGLIDK